MRYRLNTTTTRRTPSFATMASPALELSLGSYSIPSPSEKPIPYLATVFLFIVLFYAMGDSGPNLPEINPLKPFEFTNSRRMTEFVQQSKDIFLRATATFGKNPYRLYSEWGASVVLPADFIHELRSDPRLDFITPASDVIQPSREERTNVED